MINCSFNGIRIRCPGSEAQLGNASVNKASTLKGQTLDSLDLVVKIKAVSNGVTGSDPDSKRNSIALFHHCWDQQRSKYFLSTQISCLWRYFETAALIEFRFVTLINRPTFWNFKRQLSLMCESLSFYRSSSNWPNTDVTDYISYNNRVKATLLHHRG